MVFPVNGSYRLDRCRICVLDKKWGLWMTFQGGA